MRSLLALTLALLLTPATLLAQQRETAAQPPEAGRTSDASLDTLEDDHDFYELEVIIARWGTPIAEAQRIAEPFKLDGPKGEVLAKIDDLQQANRLTSIERFRLLAPHNQQAMVQIGMEQPRITGTQQFGPRGGQVNSINYSSMGTIVRVKPRSLSDRRIAVDLMVQKSGLVQTPDAPVISQDESRGAIRADTTRTLSVQTIAAVIDGQVVVVSGSQQPGDGEIVLLSATKLDRQPAK